MIRFEAPIMLTGLVACPSTPREVLARAHAARVLERATVFSTLTSTMRISDHVSFSLRTCLSAFRFST
jgi:hypothetical protein